MLLLILILLIDVTFSTPTGVYTNYDPGEPPQGCSYGVVSVNGDVTTSIVWLVLP